MTLEKIRIYLNRLSESESEGYLDQEFVFRNISDDTNYHIVTIDESRTPIELLIQTLP